MYSEYQRGELSLLWAAVFAGVVALVAMVALMSARHERNYFDEAWARVSAGAGQKLQHAAENAVKTEAAAVRKCTVGGQVVYSNVECDAANPSSRKIALQDTKGFEAPQVPPAPAMPADALPPLQDKAIEKAVGP